MKTTKKLLCMILSVLLLVTSGAVAVSAEETEQPDIEALHQKFIAYLDEQGVNHKYNDIEYSEVKYISENNGWTVFYGTAAWSSPMLVSDRIGEYVFINSSWESPYKIGLYAEKNGTILTLKESYAIRKIEIDNLAHIQSYYIDVYLPGDTDMDGAVTVKDVLFIQKVIAKLEHMEDYYCTFNLSDFDENGIINLKDVLDIQKKIAKITE